MDLLYNLATKHLRYAAESAITQVRLHLNSVSPAVHLRRLYGKASHPTQVQSTSRLHGCKVDFASRELLNKPNLQQLHKLRRLHTPAAAGVSDSLAATLAANKASWNSTARPAHEHLGDYEHNAYPNP